MEIPEQFAGGFAGRGHFFGKGILHFCRTCPTIHQQGLFTRKPLPPG